VVVGLVGLVIGGVRATDRRHAGESVGPTMGRRQQSARARTKPVTQCASLARTEPFAEPPPKIDPSSLRMLPINVSPSRSRRSRALAPFADALVPACSFDASRVDHPRGASLEAGPRCRCDRPVTRPILSIEPLEFEAPISWSAHPRWPAPTILLGQNLTHFERSEKGESADRSSCLTDVRRRMNSKCSGMMQTGCATTSIDVPDSAHAADDPTLAARVIHTRDRPKKWPMMGFSTMPLGLRVHR
jgi:hypothetical protein